MIIGVYMFLMGLFIGSFLNVCIYRIPKGESVVFPPSHCTSCNTRLNFFDLFPVLSYLFLKGKCKYCGEKISPKYAIIELFTAIMFLMIFLKHGLTIETLKYLALTCFLIVIGIIDYNTTDVYSATTYSAIIIGIVFILINYFMGSEFKTFIFGGFLAGGIIALIILLSRGMGWGDFEISLMCGLYLGFSNAIVLVFSSFIIGGIAGLFLILTKRKSKNDYIPFGPSIAAAALFTMFFGERIISFYLP